MELGAGVQVPGDRRSMKGIGRGEAEAETV